MVQFGHQLTANAVVEWQNHYMDYKRLKKLIVEVCRGHRELLQQQQDAPQRSVVIPLAGDHSAPSSSTSLLSHILSPAPITAKSSDDTVDAKIASGNQASDLEETFISGCLEEVQKVDEFFISKLQECRERLELLTNVQGHESLIEDEIDEDTNLLKDKKELSKSDSSKLKLIDKERKAYEGSIHRACTDLYRCICLLENFAVLNLTGFIKILKKFKKNMVKVETEYLLKRENTNFHRSKSYGNLYSSIPTALPLLCSGGKEVAKLVMDNVRSHSVFFHYSFQI